MHIKKLILSLSFSLFIDSTQSMNLEYFKNAISLETLKQTGSTLAIAVGTFYSINHIFCNLHELGHGLALKAFFNISPKYTFAFLPWKSPRYQYDTTKVPKKGFRKAIIHASGTLLGLAAIYSASKCFNVGVEYYSGQPFIEAVCNGLQKSFFSSDQHPARQLVCAGLITNQLINLIPFNFYFPSDGYRILNALNIIEENKVTKNLSALALAE